MKSYKQFIAEQQSGDECVQALHRCLSNTFVTYALSHQYHWNIVGDKFVELHAFFGDQYKELWEAVDELAEHIRTMGEKVDGTLASFLSASEVKEKPANDSMQMVANLLEANRTCSACFQALSDCANAKNDQVRVDLAAARKAAHDKAIWFLESILK